MENLPFLRADMAGLGKYCMGGYGRIGVYRDKMNQSKQNTLHSLEYVGIISKLCLST